MTYTEFSELFVDNQVFLGISEIRDEHLAELIQTGSVDIGIHDGKVYSLVIQVNVKPMPPME